MPWAGAEIESALGTSTHGIEMAGPFVAAQREHHSRLRTCV